MPGEWSVVDEEEHRHCRLFDLQGFQGRIIEEYEALAPEFGRALSRLALVEIPLPLDGGARVTGLGEDETADAVGRWLQLGMVQRFGEEDEVPLFAAYPLQREFLTAGERLTEDEANAVHSAAAAFFQDCFQKREQELRLPVGVGLLACLHHASIASDHERRRWATVRLCWQMIRRSDFIPARTLAEPLLQEDRHPDLLRVVGRVALDTGDWKTGRKLAEEEQEVRAGLNDRAGEAAIWHQLATIDLREGSYPAAREKFEKALAMRQVIGDHVGEATTGHQLATIDLREGNYPAAREKFEKALVMFQALGNRASEVTTWHQLGTIDLNQGRYSAAREKFEKALTRAYSKSNIYL